jgi:hypothetical protein
MPKVKLNVGGKIFETSTETLTYNSIYFQSMMSNNYADNKLDEIFIDRSSKAFCYILDHLRDPNQKIPREYEYELNYYGIGYDSNVIIDDLEEQLQKFNQNIDDKLKILCDKFDTMSNNLARNLADLNNKISVANNERTSLDGYYNYRLGNTY